MTTGSATGSATASANAPAATRGLLQAWALLGLGLVLLLAWDASGLDLVLTRLVGGPTGFAWRDTWLLSTLLHEGGRVLSLLLLLLLAVDAWHPLLPGPSRALRGYWLGVVLVTALSVPALKQASLSSCPWDLAEFGGTAFYRSHWLWSTPDGGPGRCFPSGHAVSAFAFVGSFWLWRDTRPRLARALAWAVAGVGLLYAGTQWLRGAHFLSHSLWSAWVCLGLALLAQTALIGFRRWRRVRAFKAGVAVLAGVQRQR